MSTWIFREQGGHGVCFVHVAAREPGEHCLPDVLIFPTQTPERTLSFSTSETFSLACSTTDQWRVSPHTGGRGRVTPIRWVTSGEQGRGGTTTAHRAWDPKHTRRSPATLRLRSWERRTPETDGGRRSRGRPKPREDRDGTSHDGP